MKLGTNHTSGRLRRIVPRRTSVTDLHASRTGRACRMRAPVLLGTAIALSVRTCRCRRPLPASRSGSQRSDRPTSGPHARADACAWHPQQRDRTCRLRARRLYAAQRRKRHHVAGRAGIDSANGRRRFRRRTPRVEVPGSSGGELVRNGFDRGDAQLFPGAPRSRLQTQDDCARSPRARRRHTQQLAAVDVRSSGSEARTGT